MKIKSIEQIEYEIDHYRQEIYKSSQRVVRKLLIRHLHKLNARK